MSWWFPSALAVGLGGLGYWARVVMPRRITSKVAAATGPQPTCAEVITRAMAGPFAGETAGSAEPGPDGLITAPMSGTPCVWAYRRTAQRTQISPGLVQDIGDFGEGTVTPFRLTDTTGELVIDPTELVPESCLPRAGVGRRLEDNHPEFALAWTSRFDPSPPQPGPHGTVIGTVYEEWALVPFTKVYIAGTVTWDGQRAVVRTPAPTVAMNGANFVVSRLSPAQRAQGMRTLNRVLRLTSFLPGAARGPARRPVQR